MHVSACRVSEHPRGQRTPPAASRSPLASAHATALQYQGPGGGGAGSRAASRAHVPAPMLHCRHSHGYLRNSSGTPRRTYAHTRALGTNTYGRLCRLQTPESLKYAADCVTLSEQLDEMPRDEAEMDLVEVSSCPSLPHHRYSHAHAATMRTLLRPTPTLWCSLGRRSVLQEWCRLADSAFKLQQYEMAFVIIRAGDAHPSLARARDRPSLQCLLRQACTSMASRATRCASATCSCST